MRYNCGFWQRARDEPDESKRTPDCSPAVGVFWLNRGDDSYTLYV